MSEPSQTWQVGSTRLTTIVEAETPGIPVELFFPEARAKDVGAADWLADGVAGADGTIAFRVQSFVLEHRDMVVVVDPCVGNDKQRSMPFWNGLQTPWFERFTSAGFDPAAVDMVVHTHLHEDHLGWDTRLVDGRWVPTFPHARHVYVGNELDWAAGPDRRTGQDAYADSIAPILDAGLGVEVAADADLGNGLSLVSTPGHTPGHASLVVAADPEPLVITGDVLHHPFQFSAPSFAEIGDVDAAAARETRIGFFELHGERATLLAGTHFPVAPVGRLAPDGQTWRFVAEE